MAKIDQITKEHNKKY